VQDSPFFVVGVFAVEAGGKDVLPEDLAEAVLGVMAPVVSARKEKVLLRAVEHVGALGHSPFVSQHALHFVHEAGRQMAASSAAGLGVLGRKEHGIPPQQEMLELNPHKLTHPAAELVDQLHHEFVSVVLDGIEELVKFLDR